MMKTKFLAVVLLGVGLISCGKSTQNPESTPTIDTTAVDTATVRVEESKPDTAIAEVAPVEESTTDADIEMLKQFYKKCVFNGASPKKYCTKKCLKKLAAANEYDDGGYATWEFRTGNQDGNGPSKVTDVQPDGDGWYTVSYRDMGAKGVTKVLVVDGKIDNYKRVH